MYLLSQSSGSPLLRKLYFQNVKINCTWDKNPPQTRGLLCAERGVFCLTSALLFIGFSGCNFPLWLLFPTSHTNSRRCLCLCVSSSVLWCPPLAPGTVPGLGGGGGEAGWAAVKLQGSGASRPGGGFYRHQKVLKANICLTHKVVVRACGFWVVMCVVNYRFWTDVCQLNELIHCHLSLRSPWFGC